MPTSPSSLIKPGSGPPSLGRFQSPRSTLVVPFLVWTAEGGTPGADVTVANSGGASGDAWQASQTGTDAVKRYSTLHAHRGTQCIEFSTISAQTPTVGWNTKIGTLTEVSFCMYVFFTARPALEHRLLHVHDAAGTAQRCSLSVRADGVLQMLDSTGSTLAGDRTTKPIALNQWNRVEFHAILDATVGQYECRLYKTDPDAPELGYDEQVSSAASKNLGGAGGTYRFGVTGSAVANVNSWYADDLAVKAGRWIGPIGPSGPQIPAAGQVGTALHPGRGPSQFARFWTFPRATDIPAAGGDATVIVPAPADATAVALVPTATGDGTVVAVLATATADALVPTVTGGAGDGTVTVPAPADATAVALVPAATGDATVISVQATATADAIVPAVTGGATVTAIQATATADALVPTVASDAIVTVVQATATADALIPTVSGAGSPDGTVTVPAPAAATATALAPTIAGDATVTVPAPATATADALPPTVGVAAQVLAVMADATAAVLLPTVLAGVTVVPPIASAIAAALVPISIGGPLNVPRWVEGSGSGAGVLEGASGGTAGTEGTSSAAGTVEGAGAGIGLVEGSGTGSGSVEGAGA